MAYKGENSELAKSLERDLFLDNNEFRIKVLEKDPRDIQEAFSIAARLESLSGPEKMSSHGVRVQLVSIRPWNSVLPHWKERCRRCRC